ncbi:membrane dipeptidase, partial [Serratia marcescens]|uniref:membrane dipeptidase n=2 Tax=Pseudomonadota TaxID=1224 RepID=UPI001954235D
THTGYRTAMDVMNNTDKPVVFSHSNPRALRDHPRNIPDELVDACARIGGVVCINGIGIFLGANDASVKTFVDHIDHVVQRVGAAHVGVGLD